MKRKMMVIALAAAAAAAGCTRVYVKSDGSPLSERDRMECEYEVAKAAAGSGAFFSLSKPSVMGQAATLKDQCLELRGYKIEYR
jgi:hypothetical protein